MKTQTKKITNLIIIDASGSMSSKVEEVKGGLRQLFKDIRSQKELKQRTVVIDFSGAEDINILVDSTRAPKDAVAENYAVRGMTALYDAMGYGFSLVEKEKNVFVSVLTDGDENDSKEYKYDDIKKLIGDRRKNSKGWVITFMGTTEESLKQARGMGISSGNISHFMNSAEGYSGAAGVSNQARNAYYSSVANNTSIDLENLIVDSEKEVKE